MKEGMIMPNFDDNSYSNGKLIIIFITPFIIFTVLSILFDVQKNDTLKTLWIWFFAGFYFFYLDYWRLREKRDISKKHIEYLFENNVLSREIFNCIKSIHTDCDMPDDLKDDLIKVYLDIANNVLYYNKQSIQTLTNHYLDCHYKEFITEDDINQYNKIMETLYVTTDDVINTNHWDLIHKATMLGVHFNTFDSELLLKYVKKDH